MHHRVRVPTCRERTVDTLFLLPLVFPACPGWHETATDRPRAGVPARDETSEGQVLPPVRCSASASADCLGAQTAKGAGRPARCLSRAGSSVLLLPVTSPPIAPSATCSCVVRVVTASVCWWPLAGLRRRPAGTASVANDPLHDGLDSVPNSSAAGGGRATSRMTVVDNELGRVDKPPHALIQYTRRPPNRVRVAESVSPRQR